MSDLGDGARPGPQRDSARPDRVLRDRLLLALNAAIVVVCAGVVWTKLANADASEDATQVPGGAVAIVEPEVPLPDPLGPLHGERVPAAAADPDAQPDVQSPASADPETRERVAETQLRIARVRVHLEALFNKSGVYPTSARAQLDRHRGIEALYVALATHDRGDGAELGDADGDGRLELLDAWGRPFVYFSHDDYGTEQTWTSGRAQSVTLTSARCRAHAADHAGDRYQLWSAGPNGRNESGSGDDVTSWIPHD